MLLNAVLLFADTTPIWETCCPNQAKIQWNVYWNPQLSHVVWQCLRSLKSHPTPLLFSPWGDQKNKVNMLNYRKRKYVSHRWLMISVARNQFSYTGWVYKGQQLVCVGSSNLNWGRFLNSVIFKTGETTFRAPGDSEHRCTVSYCAQKNIQMDEDFDLFIKILL